jgi:hypothetical protein
MERSGSIGYDSPYVKKLVTGVGKVLETLSILSFDIKLWFWIHGLRKHLESKIAEAEAKTKAENR